MGLRNETKFITYKRFDKAVDKIPYPNAMIIIADIMSFQRAYQQSDTGGELPKRFHFTPLENVAGRYSLYEIYVGSNDNHRAVVMFPHSRICGQSLAFWVYTFKKQRGIDHPQVERAKAVAHECWDSLER